MTDKKRKNNVIIRDSVKKAGLKLYEVAEYMGITRNWLSKKLKNELSEDEKLEILTAIAELWVKRSEEA